MQDEYKLMSRFSGVYGVYPVFSFLNTRTGEMGEIKCFGGRVAGCLLFVVFC